MYHTILQATTEKAVFGHNMIWNTHFIEDWEGMRILKQKIIDKNPIWK